MKNISAFSSKQLKYKDIFHYTNLTIPIPEETVPLLIN